MKIHISVRTLGKILFPFYLPLLFAVHATSQNIRQPLSQPGTITGQVVDAKTGEVIIGANVVITGTSNGDATDSENAGGFPCS